MKKSRFSDQQIAYIVRQAQECTSIEEVCRFSSPSDSTLGSGAAKNRLNMLTHEMRGAGHDA